MSVVSTFIDLFAGIGGFRIAAEGLGLRCAFSSEIDDNAASTYESNFGHRPSGDITKIEAKDIPPHDLICAGFPCQAFSIAGKKLGFLDEAKGTLFFDVARIAEHHRPAMLLLENVRNFAAHDDGRTLATVKDVLDGIGYDVHHKVLSSSGFGVPTSRHRIYIACFRKDLDVSAFDFPRPAGRFVSLRDILLPDDQTDAYVVSRDDYEFRYDNPDAIEGLFVAYQEPIRIGEIRGKGEHQGNRIYSADGHAITLSSNSGGIFADTAAYLVNGRVRKLAPRECARVMGFPDSFAIPTKPRTAWAQFGNSVVVPVIKAILDRMLRAVQ